jgi:hypothetical protein
MVSMTVVMIVGAIVVVAVVGGYLFLHWRWRQGAKGDVIYHFRCPGCKRRLRYNARQTGHKGQCSHCGKSVVFPSAAESID